MAGADAVLTRGVTFRYRSRVALDNVDLVVGRGVVFGLLGPNGGGKTTLFRILTTYFRVRTGAVHVLGFDALRDTMAVRSRIGVVFQHPSLDKKLTVAENLNAHGRLYGLDRRTIHRRSAEMLERLGLADRANEIVERLSGGLARRAELAKGLLHQPELLILDEPSTGLDPGARRDLWQYLRQLQADGATVLLTTHLLDEAERCDRIAILDRGRMVADGEPATLRAGVGGDVVTVRTDDPARLQTLLSQHCGLAAEIVEDAVRFEHPQGGVILQRVYEMAGPAMRSISIAKPTLEDVFQKYTGRTFWTVDRYAGAN